MQFTFHGATQEVGRSCIEIDNKFLLDAGLKITDHGNAYPSHFDPRPIQAIFISHAHLDHTGALPLLNHDGLSCPIYLTKMTRLTSELLLDDSLHIELISHSHPGYGKKHILSVMQHYKDVVYNKVYNVNGATFQFLDAGHIPGSASILLNYNGKKILYTGDINHMSTQLLKGSCYNVKNVDVMITESTYGDRGHPNRTESVERFLEVIKETLDNNGSVLIPAFAVGRAQELMMILANAKDITCPIYLDGMARKVTDIYLSNPSSVRDINALRYAQKRIQYINNRSLRKKVLRENCIILTTSGMVTGGPVMDYLKMMFNDPVHSILLTGYQGENTNGRLLLEEKCVFVDGKRLHWSGKIKQFDFSAHAGQEGLIAAIKLVKPKNLIINHGDPIAIQTLAGKLKNVVKSIHVPELNETVIIK